MKKKLEADLISIAHRVLQMKNKSDINQLCIETQKLYEKLSVLRFVEEHFGGAKPTIGQVEVVSKIEQFFEDNHLTDLDSKKLQEEVVADENDLVEIISENSITEAVITEENEEIIDEQEVSIEQEEEIVAESPKEKSSEFGFLPAFELDEVEAVEEIQTKSEENQISFIDLLGENYTETLFVKLDESEEKENSLNFDLSTETEDVFSEIELNPKDNEPKSVSLNEKLMLGISIDLNDRIGFVKNLFGNSDEDYNRVLNQLITYDNFVEARNFIEEMVKPDYDDWEGKEDYEQRFLDIIEKKFA